MQTDKIISNRHNSEMETQAKSEETWDVTKDIVANREPKLNQPQQRPPRASPDPMEMRRRKVELYLNITKAVICMSIILMLMHCVPRKSQPRIRGFGSWPRGHRILLWNAKAHVDEWKYLHCGCVLTNYRNYDGGPIEAVVVIGDEPYDLDGLHEINRTPNFLMVFADRNPLCLIKEPPMMFNFTMTYRQDSDIVWTDFFFTTPMLRHQKLGGLEDSFVAQLSDHKKIDLRKRLESKSRLVFYKVYEVDDYSLPESLYLQELRKYMELSAYISCHGFYDCALYKFMLVFEPSACRDYVHPDFYNALAHNVVPVVVGGSNFTHLVPPGSYISSADFKTPQKLAQYLEMVSTQPLLYEQFFAWQGKYQLHKNWLPFCALCRQLRKPRRAHRTDEFAKWWSGNQCSNSTDRLTWLK